MQQMAQRHMGGIWEAETVGMTHCGYEDAVVGASGGEESMQAMVTVSALLLEHLPARRSR